MLKAKRFLQFLNKQGTKETKREGDRINVKGRLLWVLVILVLAVSLLITRYVFASANSVDDLSLAPSGSDSSLAVSNDLEPRIPAQKPKIIKVPEKGVYKDIVVLKLVEDSRVRLRGNTFISLNPDLPYNLNTSLFILNDLLLRPEVKKVKRLFTRPESELDEEKERGQRLSRKQLADLDLYYVIHLTYGADPEPILSMLNALDIVEIAYLEPIPEPAILDLNPSSQTQMITPSSTTQTELITNGGFESGSTGWVLSGNFYADSRFSYPRSGVGYAYLSNSDGTPGNNLVGSMYQTVTIPSSATSVTLTFWYNITSQETGTTPYDVLNITIQNSTGEYLATVAVYSNVDKQTLGVYSQKTFDMTPYKGQTIRLHFLGTTDSSLPTTFRIDDVSIVATSTSILPTVTTLNASYIATTSATLNGSVNSNGSATTAWFEWGTSSTLTTYTRTPDQSIGSGTTNQAISAPLSGLIPNTSYYFRAAASNAAGTQRGSILSFTTLSITPTPNFQSQQGYLFNSTTGVHALYGWTLPGCTGIGVKIVDIEGGWQVLHEDFPTVFTAIDGTNYCNTDPYDTGWCQHGTAVIGVMVAKNNGIGVTGIAYDAQWSAIGDVDGLIANAINMASSKISAGDIIQIELQSPGPSSGLTCDSSCMICPPDNKSQFGYIPMEYLTANYDAIRTATANGRIVVEAGGNGSMNLDSPIYGGRFNRNTYDSGAILVGAGYSSNRDPHCWTNYGNRVDVQGWGDSVVTTGYGNLFDGGGNPNRYYTNSFSGTSSASPIVAGSAAAIQGRYKYISGGAAVSPLDMRNYLRNTGTPQGTGGTWGYKQIGPLPNIEAATNFFLTDYILHRDGAIWSSDAGWVLTCPPFYPGTNYARKLRFRSDGSYLVLHHDGAFYDSASGWNTNTPPYYYCYGCGFGGWAKSLALKASEFDYAILHKDGAVWFSDNGWVLTTPPYYPNTDYARALELRADGSYVILHKEGAVYDSATGWLLTTPPYYPGAAWAVDLKLRGEGYVILHNEGAIWSSDSGWVLTTPPYYPGVDYARSLELVGSRYLILHKDGAIYDSVDGWNLAKPPYYPGTDYAVDLEIR